MVVIVPVVMARSCSDMLHTSGFMYDIIFTCKLGLLNVAEAEAQIRRSLRLAINGM